MLYKRNLVLIIELIIFTFVIVSCNKKTTDTKKTSQVLKPKLAKTKKKAEFILKFSHVVDDNTPKGKAAKFFEKRLEELSKGRIDVQIFSNSELYKDNIVLAALKENKVQMAAPSLSKFHKVVPQLALFDLPFLFRNINHVHKIQDSKIGEKLKKMVEDKGFIALAFWDNSFKQLTSSKRALITPDDIKGQKFRIMNSKVLEAQFKALGAIPIVMPFSKVYNALKNGTVDGQENTISNIYTKKFYKVQKYLTISNHGYLGYLVVMNKEFYNSLPKDLQKDVDIAIKEATEKERIYAGDLELIQLNQLKKSSDIQIYTLSKEEIDKWRNTVKVIYSQFYDNDKIGKDLITSTIYFE